MTEPTFLSATRVAYDVIAEDYAAKFGTMLAEAPFERAMLSVFAELVRAAGDGLVADVGCGPGQVTAHLNGLGLNAFGVDLSPAMVALARRAHPGLRFQAGSMTALDVPAGTLGGIVAFYSTIHVPADELAGVFGGFHQALTPGGCVLLAFQCGDEHRQRSEAFGHEIALDYYLRRPDQVAAMLAGAGFEPCAQLIREPSPPDETIPRALLLARRPTADR